MGSDRQCGGVEHAYGSGLWRHQPWPVGGVSHVATMGALVGGGSGADGRRTVAVEKLRLVAANDGQWRGRSSGRWRLQRQLRGRWTEIGGWQQGMREETIGGEKSEEKKPMQILTTNKNVGQATPDVLKLKSVSPLWPTYLTLSTSALRNRCS